jgi:ABC-2 type transport system ATP-binding protein
VTAAPIVRAKRLSRWYGEVVGLNDVTFDITQPVVGILGPNGSGKSTLFHLVTGQLRPSGGAIEVLGVAPWGHPGLMAQVGFVPENDSFWEWMGARAFVEHLTRLHGYGKEEAARRAAEALRATRLEEAAWDRPLATYSRGMRQKTKIAQAIAHDPRLLVLDEPLTGADPVSRRHINELVREKAKQGVAILASSHVLHEIEALTSDIVVLSRGRLVARGDIQSIRALIAEHPHKVRLAVSEPRAMARELIGAEGVVSVALEPQGALLVETRAPDALHDAVPRLCLDRGWRLTGMSATDESLQAVFDYLFERRRGES